MRGCCVFLMEGKPPSSLPELDHELALHGVRGVLVDTSLHDSIVPTPAHISAIVVVASKQQPMHVEQLVKSARSAHPEIPIFCWLASEIGIRAWLPRLARAGVDDVFCSVTSNSLEQVARKITQFANHAIPHELATSLVTVLPAASRNLFSWMLRRAWRPVRADDVATHFGVNRKTVYLQLVQSGLPPISSFVRSCRLAHVCVRLDASSSTESAIASTLHFRTDASVRMLVRGSFTHP